MNGRWALGGVALTMLCSAAANAAPDGAGFEAVEPVVSAKPAVLAKPVRRKVAAPLPPGKPAEFVADIPAAPWEVAAPAASKPADPIGAVAPSPAETPPVSVADAEAAAARAVPVVVTPPLRPALAEAHAEIAAAETTVPLPPEAPDRLAPDAAAARAVPVRLAVLPPRRPALAIDLDPIETASLPDAQPQVPQPAPAPPQILSLFAPFLKPVLVPAEPEPSPRFGGSGTLQQRIAYHAKLNDVPEALVHRVIVRESRYNPRAVGRGGALGLMQIKHATARGLGYGGPAAGLLEAETNLTYAVKYLAGAYRVAGGDYDGAVRNYARGYYYAAKRQGLVRTADLGRRLKRLREANARDLAEEAVTPATYQR